MKDYLGEILFLLGPAKAKLPGMLLLFLLSSSLDLLGLGLIGPYVTLITDPQALDGRLGVLLGSMPLPNEFESLVVALGVILVAVFMFKAAVAIMINRRVIGFGFSEQARLRALLMDSYQRMPYTELLRRNSSEYLYAIQQLTHQFAGSVVMPGLRTISELLAVVAIMTLLAWQNPHALGILIALLVLMVVLYDRIFRRNLKVYGERANQAATGMVRGVNEGIEGLKEIRILGRESHFYQAVKRHAEDYSSYSTRSQAIAAAPRYILESLLVTFIVLLVLTSLAFEGDLKTLMPTLGVFGLASLRLLPAATGLSANLLQLRFNRDAVRRLHHDLKEVASMRVPGVPGGTEETQQQFDELVLDNISFAYPGASTPALENISIRVRAGESIGLVGPSGSGKTTLVDVILGLLEPKSGTVKFNNAYLIDALNSWRASVAYLPQQVFLADDSLRKNVALGEHDSDIDEGRLLKALHQARLDELTAQLPHGVETMLGERGVRLSGGQRQRVALARAFYYGRSVLVMDEATSALDNDTEREIADEIRRLKGAKTMIVIAHRLTTVQHCDRIYRLEKGMVVQSGPPEEVIGQPSVVTLCRDV